MNDTNTTQWNFMRADGATQPCPADRLANIKDDFNRICTDAGASCNDRRELADDIRFNRWWGQSRDGKKHAAAMDGEAPFPFEGASDARIRLADGLINEQVMILMAALMRAHLTPRGIERDDDEFAANLGTLWEYVLTNQLAAEWFVEMTKVAQWRQGDSPALAFWQVYWKQTFALRSETITTDDFTQKLMAVLAESDPARAAAPETAGDVMDLLANPDRLDELAIVLQALWVKMPAARAAKVASALQEEGQADFPYPYAIENRLAIKARRMFEDIFVPENTDDPQRARIIYVREWFTEVELREMDAAGDFEPGFVTEVLKHEGESGWKHFSYYDGNGQHLTGVAERNWNKDRRRGQYELMTAFYKASNSDGIPGIYSVQYHHAVDFAGTKQELFDCKHGKYPFLPARREILTDSLWDSRGLSELAATEQQSLKLLHDAFMDHAQLCTVPPLEVPAGRPKMQLVIGPMKQIKVQRQGEIRFMTMAQFPQSNGPVQEAIMKHHDRYHGRISTNTPPDLVRLYGQHLVNGFFIEVREVIRMGLQLCQQYMPDDTLQRIIGAGGQPIARTADDIQGQFDVDLSFEAGMLQFDFLKQIGEMISTYVLAWDTDNSVNRHDLVQWFMGAISPSLARRLVRPQDEADAGEIKDEEHNFALINAGVEPEMKNAGQNFALRLNVLIGIGEKNPEAIAKLSPVSRAIYQARLQSLHGQVVQQQNAIIGKTMAKPALGEQGPGGVAA